MQSRHPCPDGARTLTVNRRVHRRDKLADRGMTAHGQSERGTSRGDSLSDPLRHWHGARCGSRARKTPESAMP
jgi:hypothetical protein